ncbi:hypothetical protein ABFS82_13G045100 [Erythranthe guttata]|nr:PREDICTED: probable WRKY transcription factor 71 [Erythranthe guttata]|eukprot:XP_012846719.1 PREDICTED: probable WRKY transcription factor 71 [Erythranthe guttata]
MSNEDNSSSYNINNPYYSFHQDHIHTITSSPQQGFEFPITTTSHNNYNHFHDLYNNHHYHHRHNQQPPPPPPLRNPNFDNRIDHSSSDGIMSFSNFLQVEVAEYNALSNAFDLSCSSSHDQVAAINYDNNHNDDQLINIAASAENPRTPNSSVSFSSQEAGLEDDYLKSDLQQKVCEQGDHDHAKSENMKAKKKEVVKNKKERQVRFAFMTKSEVDNLEDGYRWRKYGQKAVKNSPFPRSYYRCTSQKCGVKKRIERSFEDPSVVITTYEGQHNHHSPATIRGSAAALLGFSPPFQYNNYIFPQDHNQMFFPSTNNPENHTVSNSTYNMHTNQISGHHQHLQDQLDQLPDHHQ